MNAIVWNEILALGEPELDEQHKRLIALVNRVYDGIEHGDSQEALVPVLADLEQLAAEHFRCEEAFMARIGFDDLEEHGKEHARLHQKAKEHLENATSGQIAPAQARTFMKTWIVDHILCWDFKIVEFRNAKERA